MGFYKSKDGLYIYSTLDMGLNKYLTNKGEIYTRYSIKIQRWWRGIIKNKLENESATKIQKWWRENKFKKYKAENEEESSILIVPFFIIDKLIKFFKYMFW
jgi:ABC-type lipoprotein release transport system permease subunit